MTRATLILLLLLLPSWGVQAQDQGELPVQLVRVLERINSGRHAAGLPPLARDPGLDGAAQAHSADMAAHDLLAHVSPRSGDPAARVLAAGAHVANLAENIAVEPNALAAHDRLVMIDEQRANMLARSITHVGLGAARGARGVYLTELFAEVLLAAPPEIAVPTPPALPTPVIAPTPAVMATPLPPTQLPVAGGSPAPLPVPTNIAVSPAVPPSAGQSSIAVEGGQVDGRRVIGYWVFSQGRWFYYPLPASAQPGQMLAAAPMPPGVGPDTYAAPTPVPAPAPYMYSAPYVAQPGGVYVTPGARPHWRRW